MLNESKLDEAVEIGDRAYRLLIWLNGAVESGFVSLEHAGCYVGDQEAAEGWLAKHFHDFPEDARPLARTGPQLRRYANYFSTYLRSSFDLHEVPGTRLEFGRYGYCCESCGYRVPKPHLQPKKLGRRDKERARHLKASLLERLAREAEISLQPGGIEQLLRNGEASKRAALAAYGVELSRRLEGRASGPASLALWREFAWSPKGSPIKGFKLEARAIKAATEEALEDLRRIAT
jgi:hypothetical protein